MFNESLLSIQEFVDTTLLQQDKKVEKSDAPEEAKFVLTKIWKGFLRQIKDVIMSISIFVSRLL